MKKYYFFIGIVLVALSLMMSVTAAQEMRLGQGNAIEIPDEYNASYYQSGIYVDASPECMMLVTPTRLLTLDEKFQLTSSAFPVDTFKVIPVENKMVVEFISNSQKDGDVYSYFVDTGNSTISVLVKANPNEDWNIEDSSNPAHRIIKNI